MEHNVFNVSVDASGQSSVVLDGMSINASAESIPFSLQNQNYSLTPLLSAFHNFNHLPGSSPFSLFRQIADVGLSDQVDGENVPAALSVTSVARNAGQENTNISAAPVGPLEPFRRFVYGGYCIDDSSNGINDRSQKWDFERALHPYFLEEYGKRIGLQDNSVLRSGQFPYPDILVSQTGTCELSDLNELSLSLSSSQPGYPSGVNVSDQCSGISFTGVSRLNSDQVSSSSTRGLSLNVSQLKHGWKYLEAVQEILAQIVSYSLKDLNRSSSWPGGGTTTSFQRDANEFCSIDRSLQVVEEPIFHRKALEAKKAKLLTLLQQVDDRYNHCVDEIHTVVSAFHAATELDTQLHARFALQTLSFLYKNLRERISGQILAMGSGAEPRGKEKAFESSFVHRQWAIQQLKKKNSQLWRPQRGLPEESVSVLRAWMFQNFLHPYPKDAEKHLLAIKSGLTRSQVSNWFINARVRLWKPMIEEMYAEMNRRKAQYAEGGKGNEQRREMDGLQPRVREREGSLVEEMFAGYGRR